jgi:hypothetical protein
MPLPAPEGRKKVATWRKPVDQATPPYVSSPGGA